jgi:hypothetical protein
MVIKIILSSISIIFSLIMIYVTQLNYKKKVFGRLSYLIWNALWILVLLVSIRPSIIDKYFESYYDINIFYILSVLSTLTLLILYYFSYVKINILEKKINTLIRSDSLKDLYNKIK